jgi:hypothetical protein
MAIAGAGAGVNELTALAATSEMAPTRKRGVYVAALIFTILPFCPSVLWAQLIAYHSNWRYVGAFCGAWSGFGLLATVFFYFPPPRTNSLGLSRREIIRRIDFVGGFLSITGLIIFLAGLQWGGYQVRPTLEDSSACMLIFDLLVFMVLRPRSRPTHHWLPPSCRICVLGDLRCRVSHLPFPPEAGTPYTGSYACHYLHLRRQLLLRADVLAHRVIQCVRT